MQSHHNLSSSSSSSKSSSISSPFSTPAAPPLPQSNITRTLDVAWETITTHHCKPPTSCIMVLQDFLGAPAPPPLSLPRLPVGPSGSLPPDLNPNSTLEFGLFDAGAHSDHLRGFPVEDLNHPFDDEILGGSKFLCSFGKKRLSAERDGGGGDGRHKRMIMNRQSAARSRARKQAYITELQREVAHLTEENNWLRRLQQQQLQQPVQETPAQAQLQIPNEHQQKQQIFQRTLSAPF